MSLPGARYVDLNIERALKNTTDDATTDLLRSLQRRLTSIRPEMDRFRTWCERADSLYYAEDFTDWGADLWASHPSATTPGRAHVSVNTPTSYVDIPSALQAVEPIENMLALKETPTGRHSASALERVYTAWKAEEDFDLKWHKAITVKSLYGRTAGRIYWDEDQKRTCLEVVEQPRNLYMGYKNDSYSELEWAAYVMRYEPNALIEQFGVDVEAKSLADGTVMPYVTVEFETIQAAPKRSWLTFGDARIEVWDYWYREPVWTKKGKFLRMDTYNVVIAGNMVIRGPIKYDEYKGKLPYIPLFNTFIPGIPGGRSDLHDVEQLIREKFEKITAGSQMISNAVAGDYWQLTGPDAARVPQGLKPVRNQIVSPGAGNRIETITPFIAEFQLEQYLGRIDRELAQISGLNDLLLGLAPAQVLSSSKAINALIANYESRLSIRRKLLYKWRRDVWEMAVAVWSEKDKQVATIIDAGGGRLDILDPSLSPRDEMETATRALNLMNGKLWSQRRAMDAVGVDDPETEQDLIREERTDATLFPESVQVMAQLMSALQALGLNAPQNAQGMAQGQAQSGQEDLRRALGGATPQNTDSSQLAGDQGMTPPIPGAAPEAGGAPAPFAAGPASGDPMLAQTMIKGGEASNRIMTQQKLGR